MKKSQEKAILEYLKQGKVLTPLWGGTYLFKEREWNLLVRQWTRPAIIKARLKD